MNSDFLDNSFYDPIEGLTVRKGIALDWKDLGDLRNPKTLKEARKTAGLYAFVLIPNRDELGRTVTLYVGKAGGIKPKTSEQWVNDIRARVKEHWKSGILQGLVKLLNLQIHLWVLNLREEIDKVGERDIERIENDLIREFKERDPESLPGNKGYEGTSRRHFVVHIEFNTNPLPKIILQPGESPDTRNKVVN